MDLREAAGALGVHYQTAYAWVRPGVLPACKAGRGYAGRASIAQEHRASAICERLIATYARQPAGRPHGTAVVATPPGERHGLPALMAAACLREDRCPT